MQDKDTVACISNMSYNALIERLVLLTGQSAADSAAASSCDATTASATTSTPALDTTPQPHESDNPASSSGAEATPAADSATGPAPKEASEGAREQSTAKDMHPEMDMLGSEYDADLQAALCLSMSQPAVIPAQAQQIQQLQPMAIGEAPQPDLISFAEAAPLQLAGPETDHAPADGAALAEDYVVISHPQGAVLDEEMAEPGAAQKAPGTTTDPAHELPHESDPAGDKMAQSSPTPDSSGPVQVMEVGDSDGPVVSAQFPELAPGQAHLAAALLAGCAKDAFPATNGGGTEAAATAGAPDMPAKAAPDTAENATGDGTAEPEQAGQVVPAGGEVATAPEQAPLGLDPPGGRPAEAYVIQAFLDNTSSQLTEHGLVSLHAGLKPNQLAVLFRNNHFNTVFKYEDALYILVTDLGYLREKVSWQHKHGTFLASFCNMCCSYRKLETVLPGNTGLK